MPVTPHANAQEEGQHEFTVSLDLGSEYLSVLKKNRKKWFGISGKCGNEYKLPYKQCLKTKTIPGRKAETGSIQAS